MNGINLNTVQLTNNNFAIKNNNKLNQNFGAKAPEMANDTEVFISSQKAKQKPVSFTEGVKLVAKGFWEKTKNCVKAIVTNPLKTLAVVGGTTLGIMALPLIGVSSAVGASVLALGFGGLAIFNTAKHIKNAIVHSKNDEHDKLRDELKKLGGDGLDLALSLPFLPKALATVKQHIKYAPKVALNTELIKNIKNAKGIGNKYIELVKGETQINYETITNEMGLKVKPKLVFEKMPISMGAEYEPITGVIKMNESLLNPIRRKTLERINNIADKNATIKNFSIEGFLRHELEHFKQFSEISRMPGGINKLKDLCMQYSQGCLPNVEKTIAELQTAISKTANPKILAELNTQLKYFTNIADRLKGMANNPDKILNTKFYESIIKNNGPLKEGSMDMVNAEKYAQGFIDKLDAPKQAEKINANIFMSNKEKHIEFQKYYESNNLEAPAYAAQKDYLNKYIEGRPSITRVVIQAQSATN